MSSQQQFKSCLPCDRSTDNFNNNCPVLHDYRPFTDYRPRCSTQYLDKLTNNFASSYDYRTHLIHNADKFIFENAAEAYKRMRCQCVEPFDQGTMLPELEKQTCNERTCTFNVNDKYGLGLGRQFYTPEREKEFRQKFIDEKLKEQSYFKENGTCCGTPDMFQFYPISGLVETEYDRLAVPAGGQQMVTGMMKQ